MSTPSTLYFISQNPYKAEEVISISSEFGIETKFLRMKIEEPQTLDVEELIKEKTRRAFERTMLPVIVDHGGLNLECLGGMPGPLTQVFWDKLGGQICDLARALGNNAAEASCTVGLCDGYSIQVFKAQKKGQIAHEPRGERKFQWDTIFIPDGNSLTYGEMSIADKNLISQRRMALESAFTHIKNRGRPIRVSHE